jgi:hypothetical protein
VASTASSVNKTTLLARRATFVGPKKPTAANLRVVSIFKINVLPSESLGFSTLNTTEHLGMEK